MNTWNNKRIKIRTRARLCGLGLQAHDVGQKFWRHSAQVDQKLEVLECTPGCGVPPSRQNVAGLNRQKVTGINRQKVTGRR